MFFLGWREYIYSIHAPDSANNEGVVWFTATMMAAAAWHDGGGENTRHTRHGLAIIRMRYTTTINSKRTRKKGLWPPQLKIEPNSSLHSVAYPSLGRQSVDVNQTTPNLARTHVCA